MDTGGFKEVEKKGPVAVLHSGETLLLELGMLRVLRLLGPASGWGSSG